MSEWPRIQAANRALFRQEMNEGGLPGILRRVAEPAMEPFLKQARDNAHQAALAFHQRTPEADARSIALMYGSSAEEVEIVEAITDSLQGNNSEGEA